MTADKTFDSGSEFAAHLRQLRATRKVRVRAEKQSERTRRALSRAARAEILRKADGRCHICGGLIEEDDWEAYHVFAHSAGGKHGLGFLARARERGEETTGEGRMEPHRRSAEVAINRQLLE